MLVGNLWEEDYFGDTFHWNGELSVVASHLISIDNQCN